MTGKTVSMPRDANGNPLGAVAVIATTNLSFTATSVSTILPGALAEGRVYRFMCTEHCYLEFGTGSATATTSSQLEPVGGGFAKIPDGATHYAVVRVSTNGIASMSEIA